MNEPAVIIRLDDNGGLWQPGDTLAGEYRIECVEAREIRVIEVSVLWYTEGKGDEDLVVHEFWRRAIDEGQWFDPRRPGRFSTTLPNSPLSYEGQILKLRWCVRVRVYTTRGTELLGQKVFRMGKVAPLSTRPKPATTSPASANSPRAARSSAAETNDEEESPGI